MLTCFGCRTIWVNGVVTKSVCNWNSSFPKFATYITHVKFAIFNRSLERFRWWFLYVWVEKKRAHLYTSTTIIYCYVYSFIRLWALKAHRKQSIEYWNEWAENANVWWALFLNWNDELDHTKPIQIWLIDVRKIEHETHTKQSYFTIPIQKQPNQSQ